MVKLIFGLFPRTEKTIGLLAITTENQQISEAQGFRNSALNLSRELLLKILAILDVTADSEKEWIEHGAFSLFSREPDLQPKVVRAGSKTLEVWGLDGEVIIRDNGKRWSRFCRESDWSNDDCVLFQACNGDMSDVELLNLVINYPDLGEVLKEFQPSSLIGSSDSAEYVEAPRRRPRPQRRRRLRA